MGNHLFYGDNLKVLREEIADESVDLIYLDPPFNSNATYNQLFAGPDGSQSAAQIEAFNDTWHWTERGGDAARHALVPRRERHDGLSGHDGGADDRVAPRIEADGEPVSALRSDGEPLSQDFAGCGFWGAEFPKRGDLETDNKPQRFENVESSPRHTILFL